MPSALSCTSHCSANMPSSAQVTSRAFHGSKARICEGVMPSTVRPAANNAAILSGSTERPPASSTMIQANTRVPTIISANCMTSVLTTLLRPPVVE